MKGLIEKLVYLNHNRFLYPVVNWLLLLVFKIESHAKEVCSGGRYCIDIEDGVFLCTGCVILCKSFLVVDRGTVVAANAVLTCSTGENEIWAGVPAKCVGKRNR